MKRKTVLWILRVVLLALVVFAAANVVRIFYGYRTARRFYDTLRESFAVTLLPASPSEEQEGLTSESPTCPIMVDFDALREENGEVVGWIYAQDGSLSYPVVQSADNSKYLRRDLYGNYLVSGTVFADYRCTLPGEDKNYILYGHNMDDGSMFAPLLEYKEQSYFDAHPTLYYLTPEANFKIELLCAGVVDMNSPIYANELDDTQLEASLAELRENGTCSSDAEVAAEDRLITLSTCSYSYGSSSERFVVIGRLARLD